MKISQSQRETLNNNNYSLVEKTDRGEYFAKYHALNKEQRNKAKRIKYKAKKYFNLDFELNGGVFGCGRKTNKTKTERNHTYYLKQKQTNSFLTSLGVSLCGTKTHPHTHISKKEKINGKEKQKLRHCGRKTDNILNILKKMIDKPEIRIKTVNKVPKNRKTKEKTWLDWFEKWNIKELKEKNGEYGARAGKPVKYRGRTYAGGLVCLDEDYWKKLGLPDTIRQEIERKGREQSEKWGVGYNNTTGGRHRYFLLKEPVKDLVIKYGNYQPTQILSKGRQFQFEGEGKDWKNDRKPVKIVKNTWGLCQILNREATGYQIKEKSRIKTSKKSVISIKPHETTKTPQKYKELLNKLQENETFKINEKILSVEELPQLKTDKWLEPYAVNTLNHSFYFDGYYKNQLKLSEMVGMSPMLELKRGRSQIFLNRVC